MATRKANPPHIGQHPSILLQLVEAVAVRGKTLVIATDEDGEPMTLKDANRYKQRFLRFRSALYKSVEAGQSQHESLLRQAELVVTSVEAIGDRHGAVSFYNRDLSPFAKAVESALASSEKSA